ncbi:MAG TPA: hypothetical protein DEB21_08600 [Rhodospirillaceae bacterium]|nr:hypothetical protein [Magnetovibrio sp.]HBT42059.1 hypothetical protein [Rhodospirillaceae bacterium]|tara:strand:- start:58 stop:1857 length:1800 start_codon:yes stop_codon:yes gene_type:complete
MISSKYPSAYFSQKEVLGVLAVPATAILANGCLVSVLKLAGADVLAYGLIIPLVLLAVGVMIRHLRHHAALPDGRRLLVLLGFAAAASLAHLLVFGTAINNDATLHAAHAFHAFFSSGTFSFSEAPFMTFGPQPTAKHWLPNNLEYAVTAVAWIFDLSFQELTWGVNFVYNLLYVAAFLSLVFIFMGAIPGMVLAAAFLVALYAVIGNSEDIIGMGLFRGFENKGLIFGFYYWGVIALFLASPKRPVAGPAAAVIVFAASAVFVSANFPVLAVIAVAMAIGAVVAPPRRSVIMGTILIILPLILAAAVYMALPGGDVLAPPGMQMTAGGTAGALQVADIVTYPKKHWILAAVVVAWLFWFDRVLAAQLGIYLVIAVVSHTQWTYELASPFLGGYGRVIWRFLILFNPFVPIIVGGAALAGRLDQRVPLRLPVLALAAVALGVFLRPPPSHPYKGAVRPVLPHVAETCQPGASILTSRALGAVLPVIAPTFRIFVGKDQYLSWQIANLPSASADRKRAEAVRDASQYLGSGGAAAEQAFLEVMARERPDIVIADTPLSARAEQAMAGYGKTVFQAPSPYVAGKVETFQIFSLPEICDKDR